ncbi:hypothetical protein CDA63_19250 [Hymenobacter amundsenii]|uniref:Uncharacterized protein n=1 Tax=Hymenobacter amundsenii TaxID=2006685 RepID=A0A246FG25_9BACT|nr:hypothetical protein [Hymenobacter amundsenii]OWP61464.1 hypothetical protein CDA63_19250 [Hymenobacter amundsenii]
MSTRLQVLLAGLALAGLTACDPALRMVFHNQTQQPVSFKTIYSRPGLPDTTSQRLLLPGRTTMYFGIGGWSDSATFQIARRFKSWEVARANDTLRLSDSKALYQFLRNCPHKGFIQSTLLVEFE